LIVLVVNVTYVSAKIGVSNQIIAVYYTSIPRHTTKIFFLILQNKINP